MKDTFCIDSIAPGRYASNALLIAQRLYHAIITPRGMLPGGADEANFGEDLEDLIGAPAGKETENLIRQKVNRAAQKDEEILKVSTDIVTNFESNGSASFLVSIVADSTEGPFTLAVSVGQISIEMLGISA